jgi:hypothetical protein
MNLKINCIFLILTRIERDCLDADLFVMVVNAESTIMMREKEFFIKVEQKMAKPNVVVLFNRWVAIFCFDLVKAEREN